MEAVSRFANTSVEDEMWTHTAIGVEDFGEALHDLNWSVKIDTVYQTDRRSCLYKFVHKCSPVTWLEIREIVQRSVDNCRTAMLARHVAEKAW